jgi:hypothetical protein
VRTTSPLPPGYMTLAAAGVATAEMVRLDTVAVWFLGHRCCQSATRVS